MGSVGVAGSTSALDVELPIAREGNLPVALVDVLAGPGCSSGHVTRGEIARAASESYGHGCRRRRSTSSEPRSTR